MDNEEGFVLVQRIQSPKLRSLAADSASPAVAHFPEPRAPPPVAGAPRPPVPASAAGTACMFPRRLVRGRNGGGSGNQRVRSEDAELERVDDHHYYVCVVRRYFKLTFLCIICYLFLDAKFGRVISMF